jgi:hypothetical protein
MSKRKKVKKIKNSNVEIWTEEQYEEYLQDLYGMEYIAGFTENGVPFGIFKEDIEIHRSEKSDIPSDYDDEIPF